MRHKAIETDFSQFIQNMKLNSNFLPFRFSRTKNTVNILIKNMLDALIGGVAYWAIGWAVAYGPGGNGRPQNSFCLSIFDPKAIAFFSQASLAAPTSSAWAWSTPRTRRGSSSSSSPPRPPPSSRAPSPRGASSPPTSSTASSSQVRME